MPIRGVIFDIMPLIFKLITILITKIRTLTETNNKT